MRLDEVEAGCRISAVPGPGPERITGVVAGEKLGGAFDDMVGVQFDHDGDNISYWPKDAEVDLVSEPRKEYSVFHAPGWPGGYSVVPNTEEEARRFQSDHGGEVRWRWTSEWMPL